jgi:hypothetical protein
MHTKPKRLLDQAMAVLLAVIAAILDSIQLRLFLASCFTMCQGTIRLLLLVANTNMG